MAKLRTYRLLVGTHGQREEGGFKVYHAGDLLELPEDSSLVASGRAELAIGQQQAEPEEAAGEEPHAMDLEARTVAQVAALVADVQTLSGLEVYRDLETAGKQRAGVFKAIDKRAEELAGD